VWSAVRSREGERSGANLGQDTVQESAPHRPAISWSRFGFRVRDRVRIRTSTQAADTWLGLGSGFGLG